MRRAFLEQLVDRKIISRRVLESVERSVAHSDQPIGSLALGFGLLSESEIERILLSQHQQYRPFGEIAIMLKFLTAEQVDNMLFVQRLHRILGTCEVLVLKGECTRNVILNELAEFLPNVDSSTLLVQESVWSVLVGDSANSDAS